MENVKRIESFTIDHNKLEPGFYISRIDGNVVTYDLRTRKPNMGDYMDNATMHSVEHMFATYIRNSEITDSVLYFGPMGCQTGFYLLVKDLAPMEVYNHVLAVIDKILAHEGPVFGASAIECGNYRNLSLDLAKVEMKRYLDCLNAKSEICFEYAK